MKTHTISTRLYNRLASVLLKRIGLNVPNDPARNGEIRLVRWLASRPPQGARHVVFDIGANVGGYLECLL